MRGEETGYKVLVTRGSGDRGGMGGGRTSRWMSVVVGDEEQVDGRSVRASARRVLRAFILSIASLLLCRVCVNEVEKALYIIPCDFIVLSRLLQPFRQNLR